MFMTFDSDSYIRLAALARRAWHVGAVQHGLRTSSVLWAHTQSHWFHWRVDAPPGGLDTPYEAEWYEYPLGIAYLLSSNLTAHLAAEALPTHVKYPYDDVLVGAWVADYAPATAVVKDPAGFHNPEKEWKIVPIDWDTVCVHHVDPVEMYALRRRKEYADEFTK
jgi:hypothetical protein